MKPNAQHTQYAEMQDVWQMCRDASTGQRAIHKAGVKYLPKLGGQENPEYEAYKARALYFNATGRTVEAMTGLIFRKQPTIGESDALSSFYQDIDLAGGSLEGFARALVEDILKVGRAGVLVDCPPAISSETGGALTIEQAHRLGQRPYLTLYRANRIINWRLGRVGNVTKLVQVFLTEDYEDDSGETKEQIRELFLDGQYQQRIWREITTRHLMGGSKTGWIVFDEITPTRNGAPIRDIPFFFAGPKEGTSDVQNPPIESLAYVNIAHYRNSADLENGAHVAGLPTPWVNGIDNPEDVPELHLGANTVLKLPSGSEAGFLQCGSEGFATLEKAMDRKEQQMAALGARMLSPEKAQAEAAESHNIKRGGENSVLAALAGSVERTLTQALRFMAEWIGANPEDAKIELNKDYLPSPMDAPTLREWLAGWQSGAYSFETMWAGLQQGELVPENVSAEDERERLDSETPLMGPVDDDA